MTKTLLSGVAALAFALSAPTAFAQDADMSTKAKKQGEVMMDAAKKKGADAAKAKGTEMMTEGAAKMEDAKPKMEHADHKMADGKMHAEDAMMAPDEMGMADDAEMKMDMAENAEPAEMSAAATASTKVSCPEGTKAQPNGTCMITGDWKFPE